MKDTIDSLQTLVLLLTLVAQVITIVGIVYMFRFIIPLLKEISQLVINQPKVMVQSEPASRSMSSAAPAKTETPPSAELALPRYRCKCKVRLPEQPTHSVIEEGVTFLVYKCGRCGKEMKIDPAKETPVAQ